MQIILASNSPRRTELLSLVGIKHQVIPSHIKEVVKDNLKPYEVVQDLALQKAKDIYLQFPNDVIIGADTIVVVDDLILGKPKNEKEAIKMLKMISNRTHQVITGCAIIVNQQEYTFYQITNVTFYDMSDNEIISYINNENVYDKAGSYAIQGICSKYIKGINGDYYNVMGLPVGMLYQKLKELKIIK